MNSHACTMSNTTVSDYIQKLAEEGKTAEQIAEALSGPHGSVEIVTDGLNSYTGLKIGNTTYYASSL